MRDQTRAISNSVVNLGAAAIAIPALTLAMSPALAQRAAQSDVSAPTQRKSAGQDEAASPADRALMESWAKLRGELVEADELLSADVTNGLNPVGEVTDLVLTKNHKQVQYILYETPYPYTFFGAEDGFAVYDGIEFQSDGTFDLTLLVDAEESAGAPEQLALTRGEARDRLASRVIGSAMLFADDTTREIADLLIDRDTGAIIHYVVETDEGSIYRGEPRTVPAARVSIGDDGQVMAALSLSELDGVQIYDPALL